MIGIEEIITQLKEQVAKSESLKIPPAYNPRYKLWDERNKTILRTLDTQYLKIYEDSVVHRMTMSQEDYYRGFIQGIDRKIDALTSIIDDITNNPNSAQLKSTDEEAQLPNSIDAPDQTFISLIETVKSLLSDVATGKKEIDNVNDEYRRIYNKVAQLLDSANIENPNEFGDLWEFYEYWKRNLPTYAARRAYIAKMYKALKPKGPITKANQFNYIHSDRIQELQALNNPSFDLTKLKRLCDEINNAHKSDSLYSVGILTRAIIDYIPPLFGQENFAGVISQTGGRSFKEAMERLDKSSRKIADELLHQQAQRKDRTINTNSVDFSVELDRLLAEVVAELTKSATEA